MLTLIRVVALLALSAEAQPHLQWGLLKTRGDQPVVFSTSRLPAGAAMEAYELGRWAQHITLRVTSGALNERSRLYDQGGASASWEHAVAPQGRITASALWICLPFGLRLTGAGENSAVIWKAEREVGSVRITKRSEGIDVALTIAGVSEKVYYYLGYDL